MPGLCQLIASDVRAKAEWKYNSRSFKAIVKTLLANGTFTTMLYRCMQACHKKRLVPLTMLINRLIPIVGRCYIGRGADFGPGLILVYGVGIGIGSKVVGGSNVVLMPYATLAEHFSEGLKPGGKTKPRAPILGDHVTVGIGARIIGPIRVGSYTKIGANSVVVANVPDGASVFGVPAQIIWQEEVSTLKKRGSL